MWHGAAPSLSLRLCSSSNCEPAPPSGSPPERICSATVGCFDESHFLSKPAGLGSPYRLWSKPAFTIWPLQGGPPFLWVPLGAGSRQHACPASAPSDLCSPSSMWFCYQQCTGLYRVLAQLGLRELVGGLLLDCNWQCIDLARHKDTCIAKNTVLSWHWKLWLCILRTAHCVFMELLNSGGRI